MYSPEDPKNRPDKSSDPYRPPEGSLAELLDKWLFGDLDQTAQGSNQFDASNSNWDKEFGSNDLDWSSLFGNTQDQTSNWTSNTDTNRQTIWNTIYGSQKEETETEAVSKRIGIATKERKTNADDLKNKYAKEKPIVKPGLALLFFGVFLPCMAMLFENNTHMMAKEFFDPFPTFNHYLLFSLIPISNFLTWLAARTNITAVYSLTALTSGMALGISLLYSLMMLPLTPIFFFVLPFGLLGLAPLISIPFTLKAGKTICAIASRHDTFFDPNQFKHLGHLIILVMVISVELPSTLTRMHLADAAANNKTKSQQAINWLRSWGSREVLLRACYERSGRATDLIGSLYEHQHPISVNKARNIYYKVTGVAFNAVPIPKSFRSTIQNNGLVSDPNRLNAGAVDEFDLDPDIAGELVQGVARGLSVSSSKIKGAVDSNALVSKIDWTINFTNISHVPREARAKILLPPNAVVTKATMWIDGIEKEAKVMGRARARKTYQRAVKTHKRDPLLVSMQGKDIVLVQCYPVLKGSDTKVRLRIASPLTLTDKSKASLSFPTFAERNFSFSKPHEVLFNSNYKFTISNTTLNGEKLGANFTAKGNIENKLLSRQAANLVVEHNPAFIYALTKSNYGTRHPSPINFSRHLKKPEKLTVVVDKSVSMRPYIADIKKGLAALPKDMSIFLIEVGDDRYDMLTKNVGEPTQFKKAYAQSIQSVSEPVSFTKALSLLTKDTCQGGRVNSSTIANLVSSNLSTNSKSYGDILWIHAAQPVAGVRAKSSLAKSTKLMNSNIYDLQVASGPNALFDKSSMIKNYIRVRRTGDLASDISNISSFWKEPDLQNLAPPDKTNTVKSFDEFDQLVAYQKVLNKYYENDPYGASALAVQNHIISPVTSMVVTDDKLVQKYALKPKQRRRSQPRMAMSVPSRSMSLNPLAPLKQMVRGQYQNATDHLNSLSDAGSSAGSAGMSGSYRHSRRMDYSRSKSNQAFENKKRDLESRMTVRSKRQLAGQDETDAPSNARNEGFSNAPTSGARSQFKALRYPKSPSPKRSSVLGYDKKAIIAEKAEESVMNREVSSKDQAFNKLAIGDGRLKGAPVDPRYGQSNEVRGKKAEAEKEISKVLGKTLRLEGIPHAHPQQKAKFAFDSDASEGLQGATNGTIGPIGSFDDDQLELSTESEDFKQSQNLKLNSEAQTFLNKGEVVPEPETLPMLLLALLVLAGGSLVIKKRKPA